ncbi:MATE family multidrug resistance protein [Aulographum hederae CBS 113979]|uniref:MATE family multidrug resistance protein n=1 Tax=Aulographum hederae CBS 113979 TaxID=1176131 RepID=A0A6G1GN88_9PEZI|nr:MATE family multidrug resistance protein [Aulographum hederae CBS 113979]
MDNNRSSSRPIDGSRLGTSFRSQLNSFTSSSPLAEAAIARDLEDEEEADPDRDPDDDNSDDSDALRHKASDYSMATGYRRPSAIAIGSRPTYMPGLAVPEHQRLNKRERESIRAEERSLLRDNLVIPPKRPRKQKSEDNITARWGKRLSIVGSPLLSRTKSQPDEETGIVPGESRAGENGDPDESTALLGDPALPYGGQDTAEDINQKWEEAVISGKINTTWQRETKVIARYSRSLVLTFLLQYSLTMASIFTVGHIGKVELGAVSLASMTATITGYSVYQGLATSLDTLCPQAYGSGRKTLVGLQLQRMVYFLWCVTIPVAVIWLCGTWILEAIVPEKETARLAGLYLKVLLAGAPGYAAFESGKRFLQAQGLFSATMYVLLFCAPLNAFMNWLFVWKFKWGFIGAPIAVAVTDNLLPLCLFLYVYFVDGSQCWGGFERRALRNWGPMIKLSLPGLVMVLAEFLAFEILTLAASWLSTEHLAAQSVLSTLTALTFQIPFPVSIAASTRIANLIGATLSGPAKITAKVTLVIAFFVGILNVTLLSSLRNYIPQLFTSDKDVIRLVAGVMPLCAAFQLFDALAANCNGILRGLGRQEIGGYVNLFSYYVIAMPISFGTGFGLHWDLYGLWAGPAIALGLVAGIEGLFIYKTKFENAVEAARLRNERA